jgi:hypothetical protein
VAYGFAAQRLMELEVEGLTGAAYGEKTSERLAQRNGYRDRTWETRAGTVELRIPNVRKGSHFPGFLESRRMAEKALTAVVGVKRTRHAVRYKVSDGLTDREQPRPTAGWPDCSGMQSRPFRQLPADRAVVQPLRRPCRSDR